MKILITGITGFVGSHLAELCLGQADVQVHGTRKWRSDIGNVEHIKNDIIWHECDITDSHSVESVIKTIKPDVIHHLAAMSYVPSSWSYPQRTMEVNLIGSINIFEAVKSHSPKTIVQIASSSETYGIPDKLPITEDMVLKPCSPYGVSKAAMDMAARQYHKSYNCNIIVTRAFNHSIKGEMPVLLKEIKSNLINILPIHDIRKKRDKMGDEIWHIPEYRIWDGKNFTEIINMSAHFLREDKKIHTINTRGGIVKCTSNHSLLDANKKVINASNVKLEDKLALGEFKIPEKNISINKNIAYLLGLLVAEGCVKEDRRVEITNTNLKLIKKAAKIYDKFFTGYTTIKQDKENLFKISFNGNPWFAKYIRSLIYTKYGDKKVPKEILNSPIIIMLEFLKGYNDGDGFTAKSYSPQRVFKQFTTKSPTLAMGLCYLIEQGLQSTYSISYEDRNEGYYHIYVRSIDKKTKNLGKHLLKEQNVVIKNLPKKEKAKIAVYDFETVSHYFMKGAGKIIVHNTGPRRGQEFVCSTFAKQIAEIEKGIKYPIIKVGNLKALRDFTDVRDMCLAYRLAIDHCNPGEPYNISSDKSVTIQSVLDILLQMSDVKITVEQDPARMRPSDLYKLEGDSTKFRKETGWEPKIALAQSLTDLLNYWRERV